MRIFIVSVIKRIRTLVTEPKLLPRIIFLIDSGELHSNDIVSSPVYTIIIII